MGQPVVHFEIIGKDGPALWRYYSELFGWEIDGDNPMNYGMVAAEDAGIAGGIGGYPDFESRVTFYVEVPDVEAALAKAENLGGTRVMGPDEVGGLVELGQFADPEGHVIGVVRNLV